MTQTATAVVFDVEQAKRIFKAATITENKPGTLDFIKFDIPSPEKGTRTILHVNHHGGEIHVRVQVVPFSFVEIHTVHDVLQIICDGDFHYVESVGYDSYEKNPSLSFKVPSKSEISSYVNVFSDGSWNFKVA